MKTKKRNLLRKKIRQKSKRAGVDLKEILEKISPSEQEELEVHADAARIIKKLNKIKDANIIVGGSDAKGTVIRKDKRDIDIFVAFSYKKYLKTQDKISEVLAKHLKRLKMKVTRIHGSRDYFHYKGKTVGIFEIVPILHLKRAKDAVNLTDASPLHVTYVKKFTKKDKNLGNEIRLAKAFCYANNVYGAESYINAFSGYSLELLVIHYKSFTKFIKAAAKWPKSLYKEKIIIDQAKHYKNKDAVLLQLNESKLLSPLILVDPLQMERNAAAALSEEQFLTFITACKKYVAHPSKNAFVKKEITRESLLKSVKGKEVLFTAILSLEKIKTSDDITGSQLRRAYDFICEEAERREFRVRRHEFIFDPENLKLYLHFLVKEPKISMYEERDGPPVRMGKAVKAFKKEHNKTTIRKGRIYAKAKREYSDAEKLLKKMLKERIKNQKLQKIVKKVEWNLS